MQNNCIDSSNFHYQAEWVLFLTKYLLTPNSLGQDPLESRFIEGYSVGFQLFALCVRSVLIYYLHAFLKIEKVLQYILLYFINYKYFGAPNPTPTLNLPTSQQHLHIDAKGFLLKQWSHLHFRK